MTALDPMDNGKSQKIYLEDNLFDEVGIQVGLLGAQIYRFSL